ncbi:MAG: citrate lyase holo-[acyl-carrier protein] synthase [Bacilli bacterium]
MQERLDEREKRQALIQDYPLPMTIIVVKANTPGADKNLNASHFLVNLFYWEIKQQLIIEKEERFLGMDGPWCFLTTKQNARLIKQMLTEIEEKHFLGKFIDLDAYDEQKRLLSRQDFNKPKRKCWLCHQDAILCTRNQTHEMASLLSYLHSQIHEFVSLQIGELVYQAGMDELNIPHKFGLVNPINNGSHPDMSYDLMKTSLLHLLPAFLKFFNLGYYAINHQESLNEAVEEGKKAEQSMLTFTNGVNTYKGLIYILGVVLFSLGRCLRYGIKDLFSEISENGQYLETKQIKDGLPLTFGSQTYLHSPIKGIRKEVSDGLPSVASVLSLFDDFEMTTLRKMLVKLIGLAEDTVLLKRSGNMDCYLEVKSRFLKLDIDHFDEVLLTKQCVDENLSFGGAADLLIVAIFLKRFSQTFHLSINHLNFR